MRLRLTAALIIMAALRVPAKAEPVPVPSTYGPCPTIESCRPDEPPPPGLGENPAESQRVKA